MNDSNKPRLHRSALALILAAASTITLSNLALPSPAQAKPAAPAIPAATGSEKPAAASSTLVAGSKAPALKFAKFVKGEPVTEFKAGQVYIVEFWATWCGPCRPLFPHLSKLQKQYGDKLTVIGVSIWEQQQSAVAPFVEEMGDKMSYRVAMDDMSGDKAGFMATNWMQAAKQGGIPSAFIVDQTGTVAWIGHPGGMDKPLEQIIAGKFDLKASAAVAKKEADSAAAREKEMEANQKSFDELSRAMRSKDFDQAIKLIDGLIVKAPSMQKELASTKLQVQVMRFRAMVTDKTKLDDAYKLAKEISEGDGKSDPQVLNAIAWTVLDEDGVERRDLDFAHQLATRAVELTERKSGVILDTLARAHFEKGDLPKAISIQEEAIKNAEDEESKDELTSTLEKYKKASAKPK